MKAVGKTIPDRVNSIGKSSTIGDSMVFSGGKQTIVQKRYVPLEEQRDRRTKEKHGPSVGFPFFAEDHMVYVIGTVLLTPGTPTLRTGRIKMAHLHSEFYPKLWERNKV